MRHRHLDYDLTTEPEKLPSAAIVDLLERGDLGEWRPLARAIRRDPHGALGRRVYELCSRFPNYGTSPLWRAWIDSCRLRASTEPRAEELHQLADLRRAKGLTQSALADRIGMSQSDLSKFERRDDVRVSTLGSYAKGLGAELELCVREPGRRWRVRYE